MDLEPLVARARERMGQPAFDYIVGGAEDERTLRDNEDAWHRLRLRPRVLRDVGSVDASTTLLDRATPTPIMVAPTAMHRLAHVDGEQGSAAAAAQVGAVFVAATMATQSLESVARVAPGARRWFQLYVHRDRGMTRDLVDRAADTGFEALVVTVDAPVPGIRRRDRANGFELPEDLELANVRASLNSDSGGAMDEYSDAALEPGLTFDDLAWLAALRDLPLFVKGVLRADDAAACIEAGASGVIVSNHGGRQVDGAVSTVDALREIAPRLDAGAELYVDGGVRSGTAVAAALALGARGVLVGRPVIWGLAAGGRDGAAAVLTELHEELERAMTLLGAPTVADLSPDLVAT
ncbi:alpha-hydroxy-acid oxidizing protein [Egibacter rhizosphaerae]|uniref:Alpha-hydroxy-acid oxidizing protein n=1 Tax=Egibacter rhizosphaerae TaxID=1670831 RepID=A0A411YFG2_9ACTN|nr:alpha-hydroxy acid oxidase [Egibacter rhizosphaerae]QBI19852.1 alpha-hydroxy-acid oxidizing protein [Egibacter rhizosphaerae]